jgi:hypothetical protein
MDCLKMENKGTTVLQNTMNHSPNDKASHPRRPESFSETLVTTHETTKCHKAEDHYFRNANALSFKGPMTTYIINESKSECLYVK